MRPIVIVLILAIQLYMYLVFAAVIMSWLRVFNVVNTRNQFVAMISDFLYQITEPVFALVRRWVPAFGGLDLSPLIVGFGLLLIQLYLSEYLLPVVP
jgi:YggT family protein